MYTAKFQDTNGYWQSLDGASYEEAFKFLNYNIDVHKQYNTAVIKDQEGKEILSFRTLK